ncbi:MAG: hypothetical protein KAJ51_14640, partial [Thermoplasmata archaeon]|nr:hypothetical protein [Thermoplasmata archaeon]
MIIALVFVIFINLFTVEVNNEPGSTGNIFDNGILDNPTTRSSPDEPEVIIRLISPKNGSKIYNPKVELIWSYEAENISDISFNIYFGETSSPIILERNYQKTSLVIDGLINTEKYYWQVNPWKRDYSYELDPAGPWSFNIDVPSPDLENFFKVKITGDESLDMAPGDRKVVQLIFNNQGIYNDTFIITVDPHTTPLSYYSIDSPQWVPKKTEIYRHIILEVSESSQYGTYHISITALSTNSGERVQDIHTIWISIQEPIKSDGTDEEADDNFATSMDTILFCCAIIIVVFFLAIIPWLYWYKVKSTSQKPKPFYPYPPPTPQNRDFSVKIKELPGPPKPDGDLKRSSEPEELEETSISASESWRSESEPKKPDLLKVTSKSKLKPASKPSYDSISDIELSKLRIKYEELNERLYKLETKKAMGKISNEEF